MSKNDVLNSKNEIPSILWAIIFEEVLLMESSSKITTDTTHTLLILPGMLR